METLLKKVEAYNKVASSITTSNLNSHFNSCKLLIGNFDKMFNDASLTETLRDMLRYKMAADIAEY